jgi:putative peptidoglycan lipid II flippase
VSRKIAIAGAIWTSALLASRVMGLARDAVLGSTLGVGPSADAYAAAFRIPDMVGNFISGGALAIVFVPMFTVLVEKGEEARAWRTFSLVANFIVALTAVAVPIAWVLAPALIRAQAPGFTPEQTQLAVHLTRIVLPAQVFHLLSGLLSAALLARDRHAIPAFAPLLYNVAIIVGGLVLGSAEGFAWGVLIGAFLGPFLLPLVACLRSGLKWSPVLSFRDPDLRVYLWRALPIMLAFSFIFFDDVFWTYFASAMGAGSVATLNYAKTLMKVPLGVFGLAMGQASYPTLARLAAQGELAEAWRTVVRSTRLTLLLAFGSQVVLTVAGTEIATVVYGTARIPPDGMARLGTCLAVFSAALGAWSAYTVVARGFYARNRTWIPTGMGVGIAIVALPLYPLFGHWFGEPGLAAASSAGMLLYAVLLTLLLRREIGDGDGFAGFLLRAVPALLLAIVVGVLIRPWIGAPSWTRGDALLRLAALGGVSGAVFLAAASAFGVDEVRELGGMVLRRVRR